MSKSKLPKQTNSEEVDLGQLFNLIGSAFNRLFKFIGSIFKGLYMVLLTFLIHIHQRLKWYGLAILIGLTAGLIIDNTTEDLYYANLFINTNYGSAHQVYENIRYLHQLASVDEDSTELAIRLNITKNEAGSLREFWIQPDFDENDRIESFVNFKKGLDSTAAADYKYEDYINGLNVTSFKRHQLGVFSSDRFLFKKLKGKLGKALSDNDYLESVKKVTLEGYDKKNKTLQKQDTKIDSLLTVYLSIRERESKKEVLAGTSGTNFFMGSHQESKLIVDEAMLLSTKLDIAQQRRQIDLDKIIGANTVNIISDFPDAGYDFSEWYDEMTFILPIVFFCITFVGFLAIGLGQYLSEQEKVNRNLK